MKTKYYSLAIGIVAHFILCNQYSCRPAQTTTNSSQEMVEDSIEYEMIVFDSGFETWYLQYANRATQSSLSYYKNWNEQYVQSWNNKSMSASHGHLFNSPINYDPTANYPIEIQHKLFYYFQYVENELDIPIMSNSPRLRH